MSSHSRKRAREDSESDSQDSSDVEGDETHEDESCDTNESQTNRCDGNEGNSFQQDVPWAEWNPLDDLNSTDSAEDFSIDKLLQSQTADSTLENEEEDETWDPLPVGFDDSESSNVHENSAVFEKLLERPDVYPTEHNFGSNLQNVGNLHNEEEQSETSSDVTYDTLSESDDEPSGSVRSRDILSDSDGSESEDSDRSTSASVDSDLNLVNFGRDLKVHNWTDLTRDEGIVKVLDVYIKNKCSKKCLRDILQLVCAFLPPGHNFPTSTYKLIKHVESCAPSQAVAIEHYYCSQCLVYLGLEPIGECQTPNCGANDHKVFHEFDILEQILFFFSNRNLASIMEKHPVDMSDLGFVKDITDGSEYKHLNSRRSKYDLTLLLNSDGVKVRDSSSSDLWLLMFMPVEVPLHLRESFITIIGVWYDSQQPNMNTFLKPFCEKLKNIYDNGGVTWKHPISGMMENSQVTAPLVIADAPARAKFQNITSCNSHYGCNLCEVRTTPANPIPGKKTHRVYKGNNEHAQMRDDADMLTRGIEARDRLAKHNKGVKGPSIMGIIPYISLSKFLVPEYMHSVLLGVMKQLMTLWFCKPGPWSCTQYELEINDFLKGIRTPDFIQRKQRKVNCFKEWKASEFYYWLIFYAVLALRGRLPERFYQHFLLLVRAVFALIQSTIPFREIDESENLLRLFVRGMERLYGDREMTYNIHQLVHMALTVRRWGPLHTTSAFCFESMNGLVAKTTHGAKHIAQEIVNNSKLYQGIYVFKSAVQSTQQNFARSVKVLGKPTNLELTEQEQGLLVSQNITDTHFGYLRASIGKSIFTSSLYKELKSANYTAAQN